MTARFPVKPLPGVHRIQAALRALGARRVVLYGYKTPRHTHHWVMLAIHRALRHALADTPDVGLHWVDNRAEPELALFEDAVVLSNVNTDRVDWCLPLTDRATYVVHNHSPATLRAARYDALVARGRCVFYEVYRGHPGPGAPYARVAGEPPCHLRSVERANAIITWATDLLPHEIAANAARVAAQPPDPAAAGSVVFVGSVWRSNAADMAALARAAIARGLRFEQYGRVMAEAPWPEHPDVLVHAESIPIEENVARVRAAAVAPAIQGAAQLPHPADVGNYVPCRIFKNISYGAWGVTNNPTVAGLFDPGDLAFGADPGAMLEAALERVRADPRRAELAPLMARVAREHTYLGRLALLLELAVDRAAAVDVRGPRVRPRPLELRARWLARRALGWRWQ